MAHLAAYHATDFRMARRGLVKAGSAIKHNGVDGDEWGAENTVSASAWRAVRTCEASAQMAFEFASP